MGEIELFFTQEIKITEPDLLGTNNDTIIPHSTLKVILKLSRSDVDAKDCYFREPLFLEAGIETVFLTPYVPGSKELAGTVQIGVQNLDTNCDYLLLGP